MALQVVEAAQSLATGFSVAEVRWHRLAIAQARCEGSAMKGMILSAGSATGLYPLTYTLPAALVETKANIEKRLAA